MKQIIKNKIQIVVLSLITLIATSCSKEEENNNDNNENNLTINKLEFDYNGSRYKCECYSGINDGSGPISEAMFLLTAIHETNGDPDDPEFLIWIDGLDYQENVPCDMYLYNNNLKGNNIGFRLLNQNKAYRTMYEDSYNAANRKVGELIFTEIKPNKFKAKFNATLFNTLNDSIKISNGLIHSEVVHF